MTALPDFAALKPLLDELPATRSAEVTVLRYRVKLITPMLGGGVEAGVPDERQPIRARSLRGQFRFWWRVLARGGMFGSCVSTGDTPSPDDWRDWERSVWGGMGDKPDELAASTIGLAVRDSTRPYEVDFDVEQFGARMGRTPRQGERPELVHAWCKYVFFGAEGRDGQDAKRLVAPGLQFTLEVTLKSIDTARINMVRQVVTFWATFGGIGSRTRRGAGAVQVFEVNGEQQTLLCALTDGSAASCTSIRVVAEPAVNSAYEAYQASIEPMIEFRQQPPLGRAVADRSTRTRPLSLWPEAHEIRKSAGVWLQSHEPAANGWNGRTYPMARASFGLPIVVHFADRDQDSLFDVTGSDPVDRTILPEVNGEVAERMASPLILRPVAVSPKLFRPCTLLIDTLAMGDTELEWVKLANGEVVHIDRWSVWDKDWAKATGSKQTPPALSRHLSTKGLLGEFSPARSAVEAFFNYRLASASASANAIAKAKPKTKS